MAEHDTLGQPRCATAVGERDQVFPSRLDASRRWWIGAHHIAEGRREGLGSVWVGTDHHYMFQRRSFSAYRLHQRQ